VQVVPHSEEASAAGVTEVVGATEAVEVEADTVAEVATEEEEEEGSLTLVEACRRLPIGTMWSSLKRTFIRSEHTTRHSSASVLVGARDSCLEFLSVIFCVCVNCKLWGLIVVFGGLRTNFASLQEHPAVAAMTLAEAEGWRREKQITIQGTNIPKPVRTFEEGSFPDYILAVVEKEYGLQAKPTPIQSQVRSIDHPSPLTWASVCRRLGP
jgi:hypothetical protein